MKEKELKVSKKKITDKMLYNNFIRILTEDFLNNLN